MPRRHHRDGRPRREHLSPREIARAGGSEWSARRQGDPGRARSSTYLGYVGDGVRRTALHDALRIPSHGDAPRRSDPVHGSWTTVEDRRSDDEITDALYNHLRAGRADKVSGLIQLLSLAGRSVAQIVDGSLRLALVRMGEDWNGHDAGSAAWEQRAVQICIRTLHELSAGTPLSDTPLSAVGAAPVGDVYILPTMSAAAVLESVGFDATNLGPQTPTDTLVNTIHELEPALVWLSVTARPDGEALHADVETVLQAVERVGATLVLGGLHARSFSAPRHSRLLFCDSMVELAAFATGLGRRR